MNYIRVWDEKASKRADKFISNSKFVSERIKKYYHRESEVIHPPVKANLFYLAEKQTIIFY